MLAIGNGEKCPWCDLIVTEDTDVTGHMMENHREEFMKAVFGNG